MVWTRIWTTHSVSTMVSTTMPSSKTKIAVYSDTVPLSLCLPRCEVSKVLQPTNAVLRTRSWLSLWRGESDVLFSLYRSRTRIRGDKFQIGAAASAAPAAAISLFFPPRYNTLFVHACKKGSDLINKPGVGDQQSSCSLHTNSRRQDQEWRKSSFQHHKGPRFVFRLPDSLGSAVSKQ